MTDASVAVREIPIPIQGTAWAVLKAAFPLSEDAWTQMIAVLNAMKPGLVELRCRTAERNAPLPEVYAADCAAFWKSADGSMMCEKHPGQEWTQCAGGLDCAGPGMPWILEGRTLIEEVAAPRAAPVKEEADSDWQDIATAPKDGTRVLAWREDWDEPVCMRWVTFYAGDSAREMWCLLDERGESAAFPPTHWMPLPSAPPKKCDHKFVDSTVCLKCGWQPQPSAPVRPKEPTTEEKKI
jgi:hypothetical protein